MTRASKMKKPHPQDPRGLRVGDRATVRHPDGTWLNGIVSTKGRDEITVVTVAGPLHVDPNHDGVEVGWNQDAAR